MPVPKMVKNGLNSVSRFQKRQLPPKTWTSAKFDNASKTQKRIKSASARKSSRYGRKKCVRVQRAR
jgi:hypothetical protein